MTARARNGKLILPNPPYGYSRESGGAFTVDEKPANIVRRIFLLATQGDSYTKIAKHLNDAAVSTRSGGNTIWAQSTIGQILKNRAYIGEVSCKIGNEKFTKEDAHPAILTKEEFESAQYTGKSKKQVIPHKSAALVGKVICAECGRAMVRSTHLSASNEVAKFQCRTREITSAATCYRKYVLEANIEDLLKLEIQSAIEKLKKQQTELKDKLINKNIYLKRQEALFQKLDSTQMNSEISDYEVLHGRKPTREEYAQIRKQVYTKHDEVKKLIDELQKDYRKTYEQHLKVGMKKDQCH